MLLDFDYESRGVADLAKVGLHNYASDPATEIILLSYSIDEGPLHTWQPHLDPKIPEEFKWALEDPLCLAFAFNCGFERTITRKKLQIDKPISEWRDVQVLARYYSLPGNLEDVGEILGIESQKVKQRASDGSLLKLFCEPFINQKETPLFGTTDAVFKDWRTNPVEWAAFCEYNRQDVRAQIEIRNKLKEFFPPEHEWDAWELGEKINQRGLFIDLGLVDGAMRVVEREQSRLEGLLRALTGVDNPNSRDQILEWLRTQGYSFSKIGKAFVKRALNGECDLSEDAVTVLGLRMQLAKSGVDKLSVFRTMTGSDGYLRDSFSFMGASRTGRFASRGINMQNLARPEKEVNEDLETAIALLRTSDYEGITTRFKSSVLDVACSVLRPVIIAPEGSRLIIADLNAIEFRVLGWVAECKSILGVFEKDLCPYKSFATELYRKPYDQISKEERNNSKPAVLGAGYRLSGGDEFVNEEGDKVYTGLLAYGRSLGIELSKDLADKAVEIFRKKYRECRNLWYDLESGFREAVLEGGVVAVKKVKFYMKQNALCLELPSGRCLHYVNPSVEEGVTVEGKYGEYQKNVLRHFALSKDTFQWIQVETHGGTLTENICQAIARDVLVEGMKEADRVGFDIRLHVHDEIGANVPYASSLTVKDLEDAMAKPISWAPGLPLKAEGFESKMYRKN